MASSAGANKIRNVSVKDLELDEVWSYVGCKQKNLQPKHQGRGFGDAYTFIALAARV